MASVCGSFLPRFLGLLCLVSSGAKVVHATQVLFSGKLFGGLNIRSPKSKQGRNIHGHSEQEGRLVYRGGEEFDFGLSDERPVVEAGGVVVFSFNADSQSGLECVPLAVGKGPSCLLSIVG